MKILLCIAGLLVISVGWYLDKGLGVKEPTVYLWIGMVAVYLIMC